MKQTNTKKILSQTKNIYNAIAGDFSDTRGKWWQGFGGFNKYVKAGDSVLDLGCGNGRMADIFADSNIKYLGIDNSEGLIAIAKKRFTDKPWVKFEVGDALDFVPPMMPFRPQQSEVEGSLKNASDFSTVSGLPDSGRNDKDKKQFNNEFNLVLMIAVLHHVPTRALRLKVLKNIYTALKPGGRLVMSNWNLWQAIDKKRFRYWKYLLNYREKIKRGTWSLSDAYVPWKPMAGDNLRYVHSFKSGELKRLLKRAGFKIEKLNFEGKNGESATILTGVNSLAVAVKK